MKFRNYISPYFLARYYINKSLFEVSKNFIFFGNSIDIGCGEMPYKDYFPKTNYNGIDFNNYSANKDQNTGQPDMFFDDKYLLDSILPFKDNSYDNTFCFQVLEHHPKPEVLLKELVRVTKTGGKILITAPFLSGLHEKPHDFSRFTSYFIERSMKDLGCKILVFRKQGSLFSTIAMLFNEYISCFAGNSKIHYFLSLIIYPLFFCLSYISLALDYLFVSDNIYFNYLVLIQKD
jgi:SAM-dependent methyltransferase